MKSPLTCFINGFKLINKSFKLILFSFLLAIPAVSENSFFNSLLSIIFGIASLITAYIGLGFTLSLPLLLIQRQKDKEITYQEILSESLKSAKRSIKSVLLIFVILVVILLAIIIGGAAILPGIQGLPPIPRFEDLPFWHPILILPAILTSFLVFTPVFFSLEEKNLLISMKESVLLGMKHLPFIVVVAILGLAPYLVIAVLLLDKIWINIFTYIVSAYTGLIIASSALLYYQKIIKK